MRLILERALVLWLQTGDSPDFLLEGNGMIFYLVATKEVASAQLYSPFRGCKKKKMRRIPGRGRNQRSNAATRRAKRADVWRHCVPRMFLSSSAIDCMFPRLNFPLIFTLPSLPERGTRHVAKYGGHSIAPKPASANATNAKVRNRQMIGRPIVW